MLPRMPTVQTFDPSTGLLPGFGPWASLYLIGLVAVHVAVAFFVYSAAKRMASTGRGPALLPPVLWGFLSLFGVLVVPIWFSVLHYTNAFTPDADDAPWSARGNRGRDRDLVDGMKRRHARRVSHLRRPSMEKRSNATPDSTSDS